MSGYVISPEEKAFISMFINENVDYDVIEEKFFKKEESLPKRFINMLKEMLQKVGILKKESLWTKIINTPGKTYRKVVDDIIDPILFKIGVKEKPLARKVKDTILDTYHRLMNTLKQNKLVAGVIALGLGAALIAVILRRQRNVKEAYDLLMDDVYVEAVIEEQVSTKAGVIDTLYDGFKIVEEIGNRTKDEVKKKIAQTLASIILAAFFVAIAFIMLKPVAKLLAFVDVKTSKKYKDVDEFLSTLEKSNCMQGRLFKAFVIAMNVVWGVLKFDKAFDKNFCEYLLDKLKDDLKDEKKETNQEENKSGS